MIINSVGETVGIIAGSSELNILTEHIPSHTTYLQWEIRRLGFRKGQPVYTTRTDLDMCIDSIIQQTDLFLGANELSLLSPSEQAKIKATQSLIGQLVLFLEDDFEVEETQTIIPPPRQMPS